MTLDHIRFGRSSATDNSIFFFAMKRKYLESYRVNVRDHIAIVFSSTKEAELYDQQLRSIKAVAFTDTIYVTRTAGRSVEDIIDAFDTESTEKRVIAVFYASNGFLQSQIFGSQLSPESEGIGVE